LVRAAGLRYCAAALLLLGVVACARRPVAGGSAHVARTGGTPSPTPIATDLDTVYNSPTGRFSLRVNHAWQQQEMSSAGGPVDFFTLPDAAFTVVSDNVQPGTELEHFVQATVDQYQQAQIQGLQRLGPVDVGQGQGELLVARTWVDASGATAFSPPAPGATPRTLYQAFYVAGDTAFTFSIAWPQTDSTDYLSLFRSILRTFTIGGAS
jgi:hypothetical protein